MPKYRCNGLRHSMSGWKHPVTEETIHLSSIIDPVYIEAESKEQAELIQKYLGIAWCTEILTKYPDGKMKPEDREQYRLPEGYHLEIKLVKDSE